ncbi:proteophosphoglycan 5 [Nodosilinea sp. LEGE 07088]|uniref:proteophosphoglycan 5 n=1 Tax=Nodosilinea sp. LEGE 07088 TaxID=2777968 RepID=UPI0018822434|nr:proteophosphoglycan 5 [Nodosilinea sp. LEGE 07088]MBE9139928.1 proteophosphoglycan 5 [Nodosilinea sp. LEGE 07088]
MPLTNLDLPSPKFLRAGWAAFAAVCSARGWTDSAYATENQWLYHDGGGNWAGIRFQNDNRAVLLGHDHEYSETYFGEAAKYFQEQETDLLLDAPEWWGRDIDPKPFGEWIGFIYGWDGEKWQRSDYDKSDGFASVGLLRVCTELDDLFEYSKDAPGLNGSEPNRELLQSLVDADADISVDLLERAIPGWDSESGVAAAKKFRLIRL